MEHSITTTAADLLKRLVQTDRSKMTPREVWYHVYRTQRVSNLELLANRGGN